MPDSQNPDHVRKLIREFQLKGPNLIPTVTGEIVPTVLIADLTADDVGPEDKLAWVGQIGTAAGVGNQNQIGLSNVGNSGILVLVDRITIHQPNADQFMVQVLAAAATGTAGFYRDLRLSGRPIGQSFRAAPVAVVLDPVQFDLLAATEFILDQPGIILVPGTVCRVTQLNANETLHVNFFWRERPLKTGE